MYSGTTIRRGSGNVLGAHQRIDRIARRKLTALLPKNTLFPSSKQILHFEGNNGPDGIKRKSPGRDEPWHFINPSDNKDTALYVDIENHIHNLSIALLNNNQERSAFEAAWLAHAVVDGLTPAHHFPFEEALEKLRGEGMETRTSMRDKLVLPGSNSRERFRNNWKYWGARGAFTTHYMFEFGVSSTIASVRFDSVFPTKAQLDKLKNDGFIPLFIEAIADIYSLNMYERFAKKGWTRKLARQTREELMPAIITMVMLAWYQAVLLSNDHQKAST